MSILTVISGGWILFHAGYDKLFHGFDSWVGSGRGGSVSGFLKGAAAKADPEGGHPEVTPLFDWMNGNVFSNYPGLFSVLVVFGEFLLPVAVAVLFLFFTGRWGRRLLLITIGMSAILPITFLSAGTSSSNIFLLVSYTFVGILVLLAQDSAYLLAFDRRRNPEIGNETVPNTGDNQVFLLLLAVALFFGAWSVYWGDYMEFFLTALVSLVLTGVGWAQRFGEDRQDERSLERS